VFRLISTWLQPGGQRNRRPKPFSTVSFRCNKSHLRRVIGFNGAIEQLKGLHTMSRHSYSRCWLHLIWTTLDRELMLVRPAAAKFSRFLNGYAIEKSIYMKINYCNPEHAHALIDLPTSKSIEEVVKLLKGSSSHWINENRLLRGRFAWGRAWSFLSITLARRSGRRLHCKSA
jgi:putative transposase